MNESQWTPKVGDKVRVRYDVLDSVGISKIRAREFESHDWIGVVESYDSRLPFPYRVRVNDDDYGYDDFLASELLLVTASTANTDGLASGVNATGEAGELARLRALVAKVAALELDAISPIEALSELYALRRDAAAALKDTQVIPVTQEEPATMERRYDYDAYCPGL